MSDNPRLAPYIPRIPVLATSARAFGLFFNNLRAFMICAIIPLSLSQMIWLACYFLIGGFWDAIVANFVSIFPATLFVVAWCRFILLEGERGAPTFFSRWSATHWQVAWIQFLIIAIRTPTEDLFIPLVIEAETYIGYIGFVTFLAAFFFCVAVTLRIALAQPGHAVNEPISLTRAWDLSRDQGLRLLVIIYLVALPFIAAEHALDGVFQATAGLPSEWSDSNSLKDLDWRYLPYSFASAALHYVSGALTYVVLCFAFRLLTGWSGPRDDILKRFD